jgi:hypothetical protein
LAALLINDPRLNVVKIDIKSFYASVNESVVLEKIQADRLLCPYTFSLLKGAICSNTNSHRSGLPEGISLSATLSELYLREADQSISKTPGCVYYARFVDDIIILTNRCPKATLAQACGYLRDFAKLRTGKKYTNSPPSSDVTFDYLGYHFRRRGRSLDIEIAQSKINKIKTRIALSILQFGRDHDLGTLFDRIRYLTSNTLIKHRDRDQPINTGIFYTYSLLPSRSAERQMRKLDSYLIGMLKAKHGRFGECLNGLSRGNRCEIISNTFRSGFKNRKTCIFDSKRISEITKIWQYA